MRTAHIRRFRSKGTVKSGRVQGDGLGTGGCSDPVVQLKHRDLVR